MVAHDSTGPAGGHVLDPRPAWTARRRGDRRTTGSPSWRRPAAAVPGDRRARRRRRVSLVTPGLIDLHGHWWEGSPYGIDPRINLRGGVTTARSTPGPPASRTSTSFRRLTIDSAPVRMLRVPPRRRGWPRHRPSSASCEDIRYARPRETAAVIDANRDVLVGVKVRIGTGAMRRERRGGARRRARGRRRWPACRSWPTSRRARTSAAVARPRCGRATS